uniref:CDP-diacylglycerol--glycerol-3-phosphate 3-phosphatidyltransferase n=1 Tax=Brassica oleracea var. oleracea TaxID=109376 RepID=A0A0D2ZPI0_BRAOL
DRERRSRHGRSSPPPPPSLVTTTTIGISPIPHRSSPPPSLLRSVLTLGRVAAVPLLFATFYVDCWWGTTATTSIFVAAAITDWLDGYLARKKSKGDDSAKTMSQCLQVKVVVMTREQELLLCRGDVSNSSPSRLKRMLQSLTGMPSATFEAKTLLYTADYKKIVLKYCGSLRKVEETDEP